MRLSLIAVLASLLLAACTTDPGPRALPARMPDYLSAHGNPVLGDPAVPGQFEVIGRPGDGPTEYWCAAGEYVRDALRLLPNRRIHIARGLGPSDARAGRSGIVFTVAPDAELRALGDTRPPGDLSLGLRQAGISHRTAHATAGCRSILPLYFDPNEP